jgi:hypothetical protein
MRSKYETSVGIPEGSDQLHDRPTGLGARISYLFIYSLFNDAVSVTQAI